MDMQTEQKQLVFQLRGCFSFSHSLGLLVLVVFCSGCGVIRSARVKFTTTRIRSFLGNSFVASLPRVVVVVPSIIPLYCSICSSTRASCVPSSAAAAVPPAPEATIGGGIKNQYRSVIRSGPPPPETQWAV